VLIEHEYRIHEELAEIEANRRLLETKLDANLSNGSGSIWRLKNLYKNRA
jgi:hypothetical protein